MMAVKMGVSHCLHLQIYIHKHRYRIHLELCSKIVSRTCNMYHVFKASVPHGIPSGCENSRMRTRVNFNLGKGAGLEGHKS